MSGGLGTYSVFLLLGAAEEPDVEGSVRCVWFDARLLVAPGGGEGSGLELYFDKILANYEMEFK